MVYIQLFSPGGTRVDIIGGVGRMTRAWRISICCKGSSLLSPSVLSLSVSKVCQCSEVLVKVGCSNSESDIHNIKASETMLALLLATHASLPSFLLEGCKRLDPSLVQADGEREATVSKRLS